MLKGSQRCCHPSQLLFCTHYTICKLTFACCHNLTCCGATSSSCIQDPGYHATEHKQGHSQSAQAKKVLVMLTLLFASRTLVQQTDAITGATSVNELCPTITCAVASSRCCCDLLSASEPSTLLQRSAALLTCWCVGSCSGPAQNVIDDDMQEKRQHSGISDCQDRCKDKCDCECEWSSLAGCC